MKRALKLVGTDIELVISKSVQLKVPRPFLFLWEEDDGTWKIEYSHTFLPAFTVLDKLEFQWSYEKNRRQPDLNIAIGLNDGIIEDTESVKELLTIERVVGISGHRGVRFIHLEFLNNAWKLSYWKSVIPDIHQVSEIKVIREG